MKKINNKEFEKKLNQDLEQYYNNIEVPELSIEKQEKLKDLVKQNKPKRKKLTLWQKLTAAASTVCLFAIIIIPTIIVLNKNNNPQNPTNPPTPPIYYGKAEATKTTLNLNETQNLINQRFPKYNFIFTDLSFISSMGYYNPTNNDFLAIRIVTNEKNTPFQVEIHLIESNLFIFDDQDFYTKESEIIQNNEYKIYKKTNPDPFNEFQSGYIIFHDHEIYVKISRINEELFNKFV